MIPEAHHQLLWTVDKQFSTDVGRCICDWKIWSPFKEEIIEAHQHHLEFVRRKHQETVQATKEREASLHQIRWNEHKDLAWCSFCGWRLSGLSMAKIMIAFEHHVQDSVAKEE